MRRVLILTAALILAATAAMPPPLMADALTPVALAAPASVEYVDEQAITRSVVQAELADHGLAYLTDTVMEAAADNYLDPMLLLSVIEVESDFDPEAISDHGAYGLMQVKPTTAGLPAEALLDPVTNIRAGAAYLGEMLQLRGGDIAAALTSYNRGPDGAKAWRAATGSWESEYSRKVMGVG